MDKRHIGIGAAASGAVLLALAAVVPSIGCGGDFPIGGGGDDSGALADGASTSDVASFNDGGGGGCSTPATCSADLRSVICNGVSTDCPLDQGCAGGQCAPACSAAAASKGSIGCDYVVATPAFAIISGACFAVFIANNWPGNVVIDVSLGGTKYDVTQFGRIAAAGVPETSWAPVPAAGLPPGAVAVLFLSQDGRYGNYVCPVPPAISQPNGTEVPTNYNSSTGHYDATGRGQAWHIGTSLPVTAYDIQPYGGAKSLLPGAELLFPSTAWGTNYLAVVPFRGDGVKAYASGPQWGQVAASQDGTMVTVLPSVDLPSGTGVNAAPANVATTFMLNAGEYIQWRDTLDMSSTIIQSNNPVAFMGGNGYACYQSATSPGGGCDSAHQQIMPISAFGSEYSIPPFATRRADNQEESIPYRFVGAVKGTTLTYDPPIAGAPTTLTVGQVVDFEAVGPFTVASQGPDHSFYVGQRMSGCSLYGGTKPTSQGAMDLGDEEFVNILPPAQFLKKYVFFTDPTYATTNLVFTRVKGASGFQDVTLDCAGILTGWKPVGSSGLYEITNVDLIRNGVVNGSCNNGPHSASSAGAFGLMVWGEDWAASYAYPAGGNIAPINTVVIPPVPN